MDRGAAGGAATSVLQAERAGDAAAPADHSRRPDAYEGSVLFAVPATVLLATLAVLEGYRWLHLIPDGSVRPTTVVFVAGVLPATIWLTRRVDGRFVAPLRLAARGLSVLVLALGTVTLLLPGVLLLQVLGGFTLALAAALVALAVASEVGTRHPDTF